MDANIIEQKNLNKKVCKVLIAIIIVISSAIYLKYFFTIGAFYDGAFLKKEERNSYVQYTGKISDGNIQVSVKALDNKLNDVEVKFRLPNNINEEYNIKFINTSKENYKNVEIKDDNGDIVFEGQYNKNSPFIFDINGEPYDDDGKIRIIVHGQSIYSDDYKIPFKSIVDFAALESESIRGELESLILAIILFGMTLIDIKYPLFFFNLKHFLSVKDPEPTDFHIYMQKVARVAISMIGVILLIVAVT